ncbi:Suppressor of Ty 6-like protein [Aphelenchoides fujianensis]|nr:Suppressor of Ty 6-like protein [Aphelenchoides fujianensis]
MSHFVDAQAEETENENESDDEPVVKKKKMSSKKTRNISSSDEDDEEDDDDAKAREEMRGFIADEDDGDEEKDESDNEDNKSDKSGSISDDLLEDDLDLVNENMGGHGGGRVEIDDDDEDDRQKIQRDLFNNVDDDDFVVQQSRHARNRSASVSTRSSEDEDDRFIVHDDEEHNRRKRRREKPVRNQAELQEAQEIFGFESEDVLNGMDEMFADLDEEEGGAETGREEHTLIGVMEPDELAKHDIEGRKIIFADMPERFQTRSMPVVPGEDDELKKETLWIQQRAFETGHLISQQDGLGYGVIADGSKAQEDVDQNMPEKIQEVLAFIRNSNFEVPFIAFYRKEQVDEWLRLNDLWTIYEFDEKWLHFRDRKERLRSLYSRMDKFVRDLGQQDELIRPITDKNFQDLQMANNGEEIMDCYEHFQLYYSNFLTRMVQHEIEQIDDPDQRPPALPKQTPRNDRYWSCMLNGPGSVAARFGLTAEQVADNFEYRRHTCTSEQQSPDQVALEFVSTLFADTIAVLDAAVYVLAFQLSREPSVRRKVREAYRQKAKLRVHPTKKGLVEFDETHPLFTRRYLTNKSIRELEKADYLQFEWARKEGLLEMEIYVDESGPESILEEIQAANYFNVDESTDVSAQWNEYRNKALEDCLKILFKYLAKETHEILLREAQECVLREARHNFDQRIQPAKYRPTIAYYSNEDGAEDINANNPQVRVISIVPAADFNGETMAIALDHNGMVYDTCPITFRNRFDQRGNGNTGNVSLRAFIDLCRSHRPHVIAIAAANMRASSIKFEIEKTITEAVDQGRLPEPLPVQYVTTEAAKVYARSKMSETEFPTFSYEIRLGISAGRTLMDPLVEYAHLCNENDEFLGIRIHPLQDHVPKADLRWCYERNFIDHVNEMGVDINYCIEYPHTAGVLQFVCGLGARKANHIMQLLKHQEVVLDARSKLVTLCNLGPTVFVNAAGFIRIDVEKIRENADEYVEQLDGSRVHPETYEWARKMAIDALEFEENNDPTSAIDEIIAQPDRLNDLDLAAFAEELSRQGFGNKELTLYDIRAELNNQYKDLRAAAIPLGGFELFKEIVPNHEAYLEGKLVHGRVQRIQYTRRPYDPGNKFDNPLPTMDQTAFICPHCRLEYPDAGYIMNVHMGSPECRGKPSGVRVQLDDGVSGFIGMKNLSDQRVGDPSEFIRPGQSIACRVLRFDPDKLSCDLSCKGEHLRNGVNNELADNKGPELDPCFDHARMAQDEDAKKQKASKGTRAKTTFTKRVISHQSFHNVTHQDAERMLSTMSQGEAIIRPSSRSINQLSVTWKVADGIYQHVQIIEDKKKHAFDLGKELRIGNEVFEDLDEILARYVTPLAENAREILGHRYFVHELHGDDTSALEAHLRAQYAQTGRNLYVFTTVKQYPGKFLLSYYMGRGSVRHEYVTPTSEGFRYRGHNFPSLEAMIAWFKSHYNDPLHR